MKLDKFVIAIIVSILLAYFFPQPGSSQSPIPLDTISSLGVSLIFLFYGLKLSTAELVRGLRNWKLHVLVQGTTFVIFPILVLLVYPFIHGEKQQTIWLSFLFLAALPSTVSSSVVMVSMARGNVPAAIFNASISGIIGIAVTPLWIAPFLSQQQASVDTAGIYLSLLLDIVLPLAIGLSLRRWLSEFARRNSKKLSLFDKTIILLIIYKSFVHSFEEQVFSSMEWLDIGVISALVVALFYLVYGLTGWLARRMGFDTADRIATQFCGTKKSLVHGTVFSNALFGQSSAVGLMLLPLMVFHALQILIISIIATKLGQRTTD
ncbi:bile acid:sodium symporter family protein [Parapedobacter koreensis]|uniref:Solute carrier family 10 (Sodium/bile acid cotransporter), member 7 n=1 Tax=Parapedobacter koreensis TaxID=332977 RepID=A0A1H7LKJ6_9SPHI|nr:bile acid:sodium symporter family protein [Parapedobacter koreensis]SEK99248.1 solute carrier family 10 (sodium/bile acid cotransporter), member 7 [Parapedobacter koreensis]